MNRCAGKGLCWAVRSRPWSVFGVAVTVLCVTQYRSLDSTLQYIEDFPAPLRLSALTDSAPSNATPTGVVTMPRSASPTAGGGNSRSREMKRRPVYKRKVFDHRRIKKPQKGFASSEESVVDADLARYTFHPSLGGGSKEDLIPSLGGQAVRNLIVSTWRSGSTFLGSVVQAHPATFYFYEPFMPLEVGPRTPEFLRDLLLCNLTGKSAYLQGMRKKSWAMKLNTRFWSVCSKYKDTCYNPAATQDACARFPFVAIKTVRFRMGQVEPLLQDKKLGVRVVLLVRDPRGSMASRYRATAWCLPDPECASVDLLCGGLAGDHGSALRLAQLYPGRVRVVRYEDLMLDPYTTTRQIYDFFRLTYDDAVHKLLQKEDRFSPNATVTPRRGLHYWKHSLTFKQLDNVQQKCSKALKLFGYKPAHNATHLRSLDPLDHFVFPPPTAPAD